jgi:hypothetical protein
MLANVGDTFQSASRIVFAPSSPPNRIMQVKVTARLALKQYYEGENCSAHQ